MGLTDSIVILKNKRMKERSWEAGKESFFKTEMFVLVGTVFGIV